MTIPDPVLSATDRALLAGARRAVLATIGADGRPRLVPICFVVDPARPILYTPLDEKPKTVDDPRGLARVRDILADSRVSVLVDRWHEDWSRLAWLRLNGRASILASEASTEHIQTVTALRAKYPQYESHRLEARPLIRVTIEHAISWSAADAPRAADARRADSRVEG